MKCPVCSAHLVTLELSGVEVDYCFSCKGIWLDSGEMERLVSIENGEETILQTLEPARVSEKKRTCPVCLKTMKKVISGGPEKLLLDRCESHGMWTDEGELKKILIMSCAGTAQGPLVKILDSMFAAQKGGCV